MNTSKIIKGVVGGGKFTVTAPITQWDYGYIFQPIIEDLPTTYRLDFSNDEHNGTALPVYANDEGAEVPEELIDTAKTSLFGITTSVTDTANLFTSGESPIS